MSDHLGRKVIHKQKPEWGIGTIVKADFWNVTVKFENYPNELTFSILGDFKTYLEYCDQQKTQVKTNPQTKKNKYKNSYNNTKTAVPVYIKDRKEDAEEKLAAARQQHINALNEKRYQRERPDFEEKEEYLYPFDSTYKFYDAFCGAVDDEIRYIRTGRKKKINLHDGVYVYSNNESHIYTFETETEMDYPDGVQISFYVNGREEPATLVGSDEFTLIIALERYHGKEIESAQFSAETWQLLNSLNDRLIELQEKGGTPIVNELILNGYNNITRGEDIVTGQENAVQMSLTQPITFIWGPPGTGKTETLATIALEHMRRRERVLMLSYSNIAVDGATERVFKKDDRNEPGRIVRYGYPRDKKLLKHEYITSYNLVIRDHADLIHERNNLIKRRDQVDRGSKEFTDIHNRLSAIRKQLKIEEQNAARNALFLATTVSKAVVDKTIYDNDFDVVIFDEASMAYIPQIIFSASLATKHFVCLGDFKQLPPIVQSRDNSVLTKDIFNYCGITKAVDDMTGHEWLCLLDTQRRMHKDIADFCGVNMYNSLLKTAEETAIETKELIKYDFIKGGAYAAVDLSGMLTYCTKTESNSRINILSAFITMMLAMKYAETNKVGVITPYNAQSRLMHAMARDVADYYTKSPIACATVHQFQGSEKEVILFDAVECYTESMLGMLASKDANRLFNVALTRAKGKFVVLGNIDYLKKRSLTDKYLLRRLINKCSVNNAVSTGEKFDKLFYDLDERICTTFSEKEGTDEFLEDLGNAEKEILIDIPDVQTLSSGFLRQLEIVLIKQELRKVKIQIRVGTDAVLPKNLRSYKVYGYGVYNPITVIDKQTVWYGLPAAGADFKLKVGEVDTKYKPIIKWTGKHAANAVVGLLNYIH